jgi:hypothetical protein
MIKPLPFVLLAFLGAAACALDPRLIRETDLRPNEITALRGVWSGQASLTFGEKYCPSYYVWTIRVVDGNVEGELVDRDTPNAPRTRFSTYLDYEAGIHAAVRPGGRETTIRGVFSRSSYSGEAKNNECSYVVRLRRTE